MQIKATSLLAGVILAAPIAALADPPQQPSRPEGYDPPRMSGFERRDREAMDRRIEEERERRRAREAAEALATQRAAEQEPAAVQPQR